MKKMKRQCCTVYTLHSSTHNITITHKWFVKDVLVQNQR